MFSRSALARSVTAANPTETPVENPAYMKYKLQSMYSI